MKYIFEIFALACIAIVFVFAPQWTTGLYFFGVVVLWFDSRGFFKRINKWFTKNLEAARQRKKDYDRYLNLKDKGIDFDAIA